jgi:hypothetical protein
MSRRNRKIKLELTVPQAVALYYAAGSLRDDIICAADKKANQPPVSGSRKTDQMILKSLELLAAAIRKATAIMVALAFCVCFAAPACAKAEESPNSKSWSELQNRQPPQPTSAQETPAEDQWRIEREFMAAVHMVDNTYTVYGQKITAEQELTMLRDRRVLATKFLNTTHNLRTPLWRVAVEIIETANAAEDGMAAMQQGQTQAMYIAYQRLVAAKWRMLAAWQELMNETERI